MSPTALEERLTREARGGDQRALAKIFSDYHQPLYRYCLAIVGDRQDAEDALQETMIKVLRSLPGEEREIALRPWLYRIAHNESIEILRRRRENASLEDSEAAAGAGLAEQVEVRERLRQLISDVRVLPERQRGVLLMREAAGLDFDEIGAALETSPAVARQTLYEARLGLREMDAGREMDCAAVTKALSDGDRRVRRRRDIRAHLRECSGCRAFAAEIDSRRTDLAAIAPLPAVAAAALLHGAFAGGAGAGGAAAAGAGAAGAAGGAGASGAGGLGSLAAGTAAKSIGTATLLKGAAAVAVVAALGVGAADRGGLIDFGSHKPDPAPRSSQPGRSGEGVPSHAGVAGSTAAGNEPGLGAADRAKTARPRAEESLGSARAASPRSPERSVDEAASPAISNPDSAASVEESPAEPPGKARTEHSTGQGHEKETPPSAAHGQEQAAGNHAAHEARESPSGKTAAGHPEHPSHPTHPAKPAKPAKPEKAPKPEPPSNEAAPSPQSDSPPPAAAEHAANPPGKSK